MRFMPGFISLNTGKQSYRALAPAFFLAADLAFISVANFLQAAGLIGFRAETFFACTAAFFGADLPKRSAHRSFIAADIRLRAAGLIVRLPGAACDDCDFGGRPRRGREPSRAAMAWSIRLSSAVSSSNIWLMSMQKSLAAQNNERMMTFFWKG